VLRSVCRSTHRPNGPRDPSPGLRPKADALGKKKVPHPCGLKGREIFWQAGFGAFSVSQSQVEDVRAYIRNQREHHRVKSFQEELRAFLKAYEVEFDERYVWD
jgi:mono/diheme cytochrome c family protein